MRLPEGADSMKVRQAYALVHRQRMVGHPAVGTAALVVTSCRDYLIHPCATDMTMDMVVEEMVSKK